MHAIRFRRLATLALICWLQLSDAAAQVLSFAVLGDTPYTAAEELRLEQLIDQINAEPLAFVLHVGDIKGGADSCGDEMFARRKALFERIARPFVLVPGDNDWTDCHRESNGRFDPEERLARVRELFFADTRTLRDLRVERQSIDRRYAQYVENMRWQIGPTLFVTLHVVGSNNNLGRVTEADAEYRRRSAANAAWLDASFELARQNQASAVVVAIHANPLFELPPAQHAHTGFSAFARQFFERARAFGKPVLLIHGDTHHYREDRALEILGQRLPNLIRLESFGSPDVGWIKVTLDADRGEFVIEPRR